jgi:ribonuclease P protein component
VLPADQRLTRPSEFSATVRHGRRVGRPRVVVHVLPLDPRSSAARSPVDPRPEPVAPASGAVLHARSARVGLVVSKAVGNAVVRHRVSRRLRHVVGPLVPRLAAGTAVVLRALPAAATATSAELAADVGSALRRLGVLEDQP